MPHWCYVIIVFLPYLPAFSQNPHPTQNGVHRYLKEGGQELYRAYFYIVLDGVVIGFSMLDMAGLPFDTPVLHLKFSRPASCIVIQAGISRHC